MTSPNQHASWAINLALEIDLRCVGFAGAILRASGKRKQVIAAHLSAKPPAECQMGEIGQFLLEANHRSILAAAHGDVAEGLRGSLYRAGETIREARFYTLLHQLLAKPPHAEIRNCIFRLPKLDLTKLLIVRLLPQALCRANVVETIDCTQAANDVATAFRLLVQSGIGENELAAAIRQVRSERELAKVWQRWSLKVRAPTQPVPASDWFRPMMTGADLHQSARRFRNCARRYTYEFLENEAAFAEARVGNERAVVHLARKDKEWRLDGIFGPRNSRPSQALRGRVEQHLAAHGVRTEVSRRPKESEWDALRRLSAVPFELDFDFG